MIKIHPTEVFALRKAGWTLQALADRYGVSRPAIHHYLTRARSRVNIAAVERDCVSCGQPVKASAGRRTQRRVFCSPECYHVWYPLDHYVQNRTGQRAARRLVSGRFELKAGYVVHHVDGDNRNNRLSNLWVFASQADHMSWHRGGEGKPIWVGE